MRAYVWSAYLPTTAKLISRWIFVLAFEIAKTMVGFFNAVRFSFITAEAPCAGKKLAKKERQNKSKLQFCNTIFLSGNSLHQRSMASSAHQWQRKIDSIFHHFQYTVPMLS